MATDEYLAEIDALVGASSLGSEGMAELCARTPDETVTAIRGRASARQAVNDLAAAFETVPPLARLQARAALEELVRLINGSHDIGGPDYPADDLTDTHDVARDLARDLDLADRGSSPTYTIDPRVASAVSQAPAGTRHGGATDIARSGTARYLRRVCHGAAWFRREEGGDLLIRGEPAARLAPHIAADAIEADMLAQLDRRIRKSVVFTSGAVDPIRDSWDPSADELIISRDDPRLRRMPDEPTLVDFFRLRFSASSKNHLLQSAKLALTQGYGEKVVTACLLHDISMAGFIRGDHGYWGAQLVDPYVDEEVSWAIRAHQALRFFADESVGYAYPESYRRMFGEDYVPPPYIQREYARTRRHRWYMTGRLITLNDLYSFDPEAEVSIDEFVDIIGRNFTQPREGLGFDNSPAAHIWRTMIWPTRSL